MSVQEIRKLTTILVCIAGCILSSSVAYLTYRDGQDLKEFETQEAFLEFKNNVDDRASAFNRDLEVNFEALRSIGILFSGDGQPGRDDFSQLSESILLRHSAIQAFSWVPRVQHSDRSYSEKEARNVFPNYEISQRGSDGIEVASKRSEYFPVSYIYPLAGNERALGFDLASDYVRAIALVNSRDSGKLRATSSITLVQETGQQKGFLAFLPIYSGSQATVEDRQRNLTGFITSVYRIGDIFESSARSRSDHPDISFKILEELAGGGKQTILDSNESDDFSYEYGFIANESDYPRFVYETDLADILGQQWRLSATSSSAEIKRTSLARPALIFLLGTLFTGIIAFYLRKLGNRTDQLAVINKQLDALSHTDGLTGICNRRRFDEFIKSEWLRSARSKTSISLLMIDVDFFKQYNDHYGHYHGDRILKQIASALDCVIQRPSDILARYGGEEFVVVLPDTDDAAPVADRCLQAVRDLKLPHEFSDAASVITVSIGFYNCIPDLSQGLGILTENADKALYIAKWNGRNQAVKYTAQSSVSTVVPPHNPATR